MLVYKDSQITSLTPERPRTERAVEEIFSCEI